MTVRIAKLALIFGTAILYSLVVLNNLTDYNVNFAFVRHVLAMDSTFPENRLMWRALNSPAWHTAFYLSIIAWEFATTLLLWWGGVRAARRLAGTAEEFRAASEVAISGLVLGMMLWLVAFLAIGGNWFLMWQSKSWNGQEAAFQMFILLGIVLLTVLQPDSERA